MPIPTLNIDNDQAEKILSLREDHFTDMKSRAVTPAKLTKAISAMANADGGEVYIGVAESDGIFSWEGFGDEEEANGHLQIFERLFPLGDGFQYEFLASPQEAGFVLHIVVQRSSAIRRASDGKIYLRRGARRNLWIPTRESRSWKGTRGSHRSKQNL